MSPHQAVPKNSACEPGSVRRISPQSAARPQGPLLATSVGSLLTHRGRPSRARVHILPVPPSSSMRSGRERSQPFPKPSTLGANCSACPPKPVPKIRGLRQCDPRLSSFPATFVALGRRLDGESLLITEVLRRTGQCGDLQALCGTTASPAVGPTLQGGALRRLPKATEQADLQVFLGGRAL